MMKIKRTALIMTVVVIFAVLFSSSVFADTSPLPRETQTNSSVVNNVTFNIKVSRFYTDATTALQGGGTLPYFVSIAVINNNDDPALVNGLRYKIVFAGSDTFYYQGYDNYSNDLFTTMLPTDANNYVSVSSSADYSYGNGIVVPPHKAIYLSGLVELATTLDQSTMTWPVPTMSHVYFPNDITVTTGDYPYNGEPIDYTPVLDALYRFEQNSPTDDQIEDVKTLLNSIYVNNTQQLMVLTDLLNNMTYSGNTNPVFPNQSGYYGQNVSTVFTNEYITGHSIRMTVYKPTLDTISHVLDPTNDTVNEMYTYHRHVIIVQRITVSKDCSFKSNRWITFYPQTFGSNPSSLDNFKITSDWINTYTYVSNNNRFNLYSSITVNQFDDIYLSKGNHYLIIEYDLVYTSDQSPTFTFPTNSADIFTFGSSWSDSSLGYSYNELNIINDIDLKLNELLDNYNRVNGVQDVTDDSDALDTTGDQVHTQEQAYYTANRSAIQATGLSNYQFDQDQSNGIGAVSSDFTALWNAMGSWTSVYIFALTIGLAMMILRHVPSMVKSHRSKQIDD